MPQTKITWRKVKLGEIADLIAYPIGVSILDSKRENKAFDIVKTKFHNKNGTYENYGLKIFP